MSQLDFHNNSKNSSFNPPPNGFLRLLPILQKTKDAYLLWYEFYQALPKTHKYTFGQKIDTLFAEIIEAIAAASFLTRMEKLPFVRLAIKKVDALKIFLLILWETKSLGDKRYIAISLRIDEIGKMLGGWNGQIVKQNSPDKTEEK